MVFENLKAAVLEHLTHTIIASFLENYRFREDRRQALGDPAAIGKTGKLSRRPLVRTDAADMLKRRLKQAGLPAHYSPHSFRATGITNFSGK
jgi:integrase/recombinase XerD